LRRTAQPPIKNYPTTTDAAKPATGAAAGGLKAVAPKAERFKTASPAEAAAWPAPGAETFEALETRLALGVDLAAIEGLALVRFAQDFISSVQLGKARGRPRVMLVGVRMQLLGLPAESALDLGGTRGLRHPQGVIGVTHPQSLSGTSPFVMPGIAPTYPCSMWGAPPPTATRDGSRAARASGARSLTPTDNVGVLTRFQGCVQPWLKRGFASKRALHLE